MFLSELLGINLSGTGMFNALIDKDNNFFINVIRLKKATVPEFRNAYERLNQFFSDIATLLDKADEADMKDLFYRSARNCFIFHEVNGINLGFSETRWGTGWGDTTSVLLGEMDHSRAWRKSKGLDGLIEKLEFGKKKVPENELDSIASMIDPERDGKTILLTGSLEEKEIGSVCAALSAKLREKGMTLTVQPSFLHNSKAVMLKIGNAKVIGAVLI